MMKALAVLVGLALFIIAGQQLHRTACDQRITLYGVINSDTLTCAAFYQEVICDGHPYDSFYFPTTNVMFPDFCIYFVARTITGATAPAMVLCTCVLVVLQLAGFFFIMRQLSPPGQRWRQTAILLGMGALFLLVNARSGLGDSFFRLPLVLTYHAGSHICLLFGFALLLHLLNARCDQRCRLAYVTLYMLTALGMGSDRLLLIQFILPAIGALLATRLLAGPCADGVSVRKAGALTGVMLSGALSGQFLLRIFQPPWQDIINHYPFTLENGLHSLQLFTNKWTLRLKACDELHWLTVIWIAASAANLIFHGMRRWLIRSALPLTSQQRGQLFLSAHYLLMTATCIGAICYSGIVYDPPIMLDFDWGGAARYFLPTLFMPYFLIGLWMAPLRGWTARHLPTAAAFGLLVYVAVGLEECNRIPREDSRAVWNYYPPEVERLDAIAEQYGLEYGLAAYWEAKVMSLLSHRQLRVHAVIANPIANTKMVSFHWLNSGRCYFDAPRGGSGSPRYQFILVKECPMLPTPTRAELTERFGPPQASEPCGPFHVFVYNRPKDSQFQDLVNQDCFFMRGRFEFKIGESIRFDARTLTCSILGEFPPPERIAIEDCVPAGLLSAGPLLHVREPGTYRVKIVTSSSQADSPSRWQVILVNPKRFGPTTVAATGEIEPGEMKENVVDVVFGNRRLGRAIECDVMYSGEGTLQMHYVEITRIE